MNFEMMQRHKYSLSELNEMLPWEREIYVSLLIEHIKEENKRQKEEVSAINSKYKTPH